MSPHQTLAVTVRLAAIWLFLYAISNMAGTYVEAHKYSDPDSLLPILFGFGIIMIICGLLWSFPLFVARKLLPPSGADNTQSTVFDSWFSVGCSLLGVWVLVKAVPALISYTLGNYLGQNSGLILSLPILIGYYLFLLMSFSLSWAFGFLWVARD